MRLRENGKSAIPKTVQIEGKAMETEMDGPIVAKLTRQTLKQIKGLSLPDFRAWLIEYSNQVYNMGIDDCKIALHEEFGFGPERLKRMTEHIAGAEGRNQ